jgi:hypothetical protein
MKMHNQPCIAVFIEKPGNPGVTTTNDNQKITKPTFGAEPLNNS